MKKFIIITGIMLVSAYFFSFSGNGGNKTTYDFHKNIEYKSHTYYNTDDEKTYDDGYEWAEENFIDDFNDCDYEFGAGTEAEDGCNEYVQENKGYEDLDFYGYDCTEDCSGHEAGYEWAEENGIYDPDDCGGYSESFIEGCRAYAEEYGF